MLFGKSFYILGLTFLGLGALALAVPQSRFLILGFPEERVQGRDRPAAFLHTEEMRTTDVETMLQVAGLNPEPVLGDIGIAGHMGRVQNGSVSLETLERYAGGLISLNEKTTALGQVVPASFWDVGSAELARDQWNSYRIVAELNTEQGAPFLQVLVAAWARFHSFKSQPASGTDTALDTALDMFEPVIALLQTHAPDDLLERSPYITTKEHAAVYLWQNIIVGSSRGSLLPSHTIFDHGFVRRFHVGTIWQYEVGEAQNNSDIWGVTGFADQFVGPLQNSNQIEHLSISMVVQGVLREPVIVLDAYENYESLLGAASPEEARADKSLNMAIAEVFLPLFEQDLPEAVNELRVHLKAD